MAHPHIRTIRDLVAEIAQQIAITRQITAKATEVLTLPVPDTFMGRKTHEPFPKEIRNGGGLGEADSPA